MAVDSKTHTEHRKYFLLQSHFLRTKQQSVIYIDHRALNSYLSATNN